MFDDFDVELDLSPAREPNSSAPVIVKPIGRDTMKKTLAAVAIGSLLLAGQAAATSQGAARVGDRVGATAESSSEFLGIPVIGLLAIAGVIAAAVVVVSDDDSESD
jgi:hypothetical protein